MIEKKEKTEISLWIALVLAIVGLIMITGFAAFGEESSLLGKPVRVWQEDSSYNTYGEKMLIGRHGIFEGIKDGTLTLTVQGHPITKTIVLKKWTNIEQADAPVWWDYLYLRNLDLTIETLESRGIKYLTRGFPYGGMDFLNRAGMKRYQANRQPSKYITEEMIKRGRHWNFAYKQWMTDTEEALASGMILYRGKLIQPGQEDKVDYEIEARKKAKAEQKAREAFKKKWLTPKKLTEAEEIELRDIARVYQHGDLKELEGCIADHKSVIINAKDDKTRALYYKPFNHFYYVHKFIIELKSKQNKNPKTDQPQEQPWRVRFGIKRND